MKEGTKEVYMYVLGGIVVVGLLAVIAYKLYAGLDAQLETGALISGFTIIIGFFFGSSKSSNDKTKIMAEK